MITTLIGQSFPLITPSRPDQNVSGFLQTFYFSVCNGNKKRFSGNILKNAPEKDLLPHL